MQDPTSDLSKSFGGTIHSLDELVPAMKQFVKEGGSMADVMEVVDLRQAGAFEQMLSTTDVTLKLRDALLNANGEGERMALIVGDTLQGAWLKFKSAIEGASIVLFSLIAGPFKDMVEGVASFFNNVTLLVEGFDSLNEKIVETAKTFQKEQKATEDLINEYSRLDSITKKTKEEKIRFGIVTKELEKNIGDSIKVIDKETGALVLNSKALDVAIARHALLADGEAVKLVRQLNKVKKELDGNNKALGENNTVIQQNQDLLDELTTTESQREVNLKQAANTQKLLNAEGEEQIAVTGKVNLLNSEQFALTQKIEGLKQKSLTTRLKDNDLKKEESELLKMLNDLGYSNEEINNLNAKSLQGVIKELDIKKGLIEGNTKATKENLDVEREMVELLMNQGVRSKEEEARIQEYLNGLREKEIELQLKSLNEFVMDINLRKQLLLELDALQKSTDKDDQDRKEESFQADIARAIMSGQSAEEAVRTVIKAQIMKAVSGLIASIFANVPFPASLILVAGASKMVGKILDTQLGNFGDGGVVEEFANGGMVQGASHANGGVKFAVGGRVNELEGGEAVINKRSTAMFKDQLSSMNQAGGGVKFADGGLLNSPTFAQQQFSMGGKSTGSQKVYVVEADISNTQQSVNVLQAAATL
tara:strand:- start:1206 stop:3152 length:1947 start_codon:yes stop_codon:yes gene_type:complete